MGNGQNLMLTEGLRHQISYNIVLKKIIGKCNSTFICTPFDNGNVRTIATVDGTATTPLPSQVPLTRIGTPRVMISII